MLKLNTLFTIPAIIILCGCGDNQPIGRQMPSHGDVLAKVNNISITQTELDLLNQTRQSLKQTTSLEEGIIELTNIELLRQYAVEKQLHLDAKVAAEMNQKSVQVLAGAAVQQFAKDLIITEQDLMMKYNEYTSNLPDQEYHLRHILSKTQKEAEINIEDLTKGVSFQELAQKRSIDSSSENGGDLGWVYLTNLSDTFKSTLEKVEVGKHSMQALQSAAGWHVLMVEAKRDLKPASFNELRSNIQSQIRNQKIKGLIAQLREKADIKTPGIKQPAHDNPSKAEPTQNESDSTAN